MKIVRKFERSGVPGRCRGRLLARRLCGGHAGLRRGPDSQRALFMLRGAARRLGITLLPLEARTANEVERALAVLHNERVGALFVPAPVAFPYRKQIMDFAARNRLPVMYDARDPVEAGGLMSYGPNFADQFRRAATSVDKILKGAKPANLPVEQPTPSSWS